jgi:hypothetical protein
MDIAPEVAKSLGFPRACYTAGERWRCRKLPRGHVARTEAIDDLSPRD